MKYYPISKLFEVLKESGLSASYSWLLREEKAKRLKCPRKPNKRGDRIFTLEDIEGIVKAYSPGGMGQWSLMH